MKALRYILYFLLGLAALIGGLGLFAKNTYHIERSIEVDAPKAMVYEQIRLFTNFHEWSPWSQLDTTMKLTYAGKDGEVGASYSWVGNDDVGKGKETIQSVSPDRLELQLDLTKPFESSFPTFFNISGNEEKTKVTWGLDPKFPFPYNVLAMFTDVDKAMGIDYERGLGYLKRRCEGMAHKKFRGYEVAEEEIPAAYYVSVRRTIPFAEIPAFFEENLPKVMGIATTEKLTLAGAPSGLFWIYDEEAGTTDVGAAIPVAEEKKFGKEFQVNKLGGGKALVINYLGDYANTEEAHMAMDEYMAGNKLRNVPPVIETYISGPGTELDTAKWLTRVIYFVEPMPDSTDIKK